jgi:radical SAM superfamily enzyme YgiQ (UPF0313 family)
MSTPAVATAPRKLERVLFLRLPPFLGYKSHHPRDITIPFTVIYSATLVKETGRHVTAMDLWGKDDTTLEECIESIKAENPDVVLFECSAGATPLILRCAEALREALDPVIIGFGSVPTYTPDRIFGADKPFDYGLCAECEETALELLDALEQGTPVADVKGLVYWDAGSGEMVQTDARPLIKDLDSLPIPDYNLVDLDQYHMYSFPVPLFRAVKWGQMLSSRGCPYPCTHCSFDHRQTFGRPFRTLSPERVVDNMEAMVSHGANAISIEDDCFSLKRAHAVAVCDEIERRGLKVKWVAQTRVDLIDRDLIARMKRVGCVGLSLGIESGNDRVLKHLKKGFTREQALEGIREAQNQGIMLRLLFMVGMPTETADEIRDTITLALEAKAITVQAHICTPYPGTTLLGEAEQDGRYVTDFSSYDKIVYNMSQCSDEELWALQKEFYSRYYFSWHYFKTFARQRLLYLPGSWRRDVPLLFRALWYLLWASRKQQQRDVDGAFSTSP